jgi:hypothetical protein
MVGGRQVLLSIAVLSGLVVENVCGGEHPPNNSLRRPPG